MARVYNHDVRAKKEKSTTAWTWSRRRRVENNPAPHATSRLVMRASTSSAPARACTALPPRAFARRARTQRPRDASSIARAGHEPMMTTTTTTTRARDASRGRALRTPRPHAPAVA